MNKEELDSFESLDIDLNDVDDLDMGLEIISYKTRQIIQELAEAVMEQSRQLQAYKDKEDKLREYITNKTHFMTENGVQYMCNSDDLLQILNEGE